MTKKPAGRWPAATPPVNNDGVLGTYETNWTVRDTDGDRLWDGFDYVVDTSGPSWHYGELYFSALAGEEWERTFFQDAEQSDDTNATVADTDGDGMRDGDEVYDWGKSVEVDQPSSNPTYTNFTSDPSDSDTDDDGLNDSAEFNFDSHPLITDTDLDGLRDKEEFDYGTVPKDFDTDGDMIPDGYVEDWWRDSDGTWSVSSNSDGNSVQNVWESEDFDLDGVKDAGETDATDGDSDNDSIEDGYEYFYDYIFGIMDPTATTFMAYSNEDPDNDGTDNALDSDSDGDNLNDGDEDLNGDGAFEGTESGGSYPSYATGYESNPYDDDTDGDNVNDDTDWTVSSVNYYDADFDNDNLICPVDVDSDGDATNDDTDTAVTNTGSTDADGDGLTEAQEHLVGSDPNDADTDNDGLYDGWVDSDSDMVWDVGETYGEVGDPDASYNGGHGTIATNDDTDGDLLNDGDEITFESDPLDIDSDDDGLSDYLEYTNNADPNDADSDNDGIDDDIEVATGTDPDDLDSDDDGIPDGWIDGWGYSAMFGVNSVYPMPGHVDSIAGYNYGYGDLDGEIQKIEGEDYDGDGIKDYDDDEDDVPESRGPDDGDGLSDGDEFRLGTDPDLADSDGDGVNDNVDYCPMVFDARLNLNIYELICFDEKIDPGDPGEDPCDFHVEVKFWEYSDDYWQKLNEDDRFIHYEDRYTSYQNLNFVSNTLKPDTRWIAVGLHVSDYDENGGSNDYTWLDINPKDGGMNSIILYYDMATSLWNDAGKFDTQTSPPAYDELNEGLIAYKMNNNVMIEGDMYDVGYINGLNDGCERKAAAVSFDLRPTDSDNDYLTAYSEYHYWNTKIKDPDGYTGLLWDTDGDLLPDGYEIWHNMDPVNNNDYDKDYDQDGLSNMREFLYMQYGTHPRRKDILVEVDWMYGMVETSGSSGTSSQVYYECELPQYSQLLVIESFAKKDISMHIDDGCMGGGGAEIPIGNEIYKVSSHWTTYNEYESGQSKINGNEDIYDNGLDIKWGKSAVYPGFDEPSGVTTQTKLPEYSSDSHFTISRYRSFHYCIIQYNQKEGKQAEMGGDDFVISIRDKYESSANNFELNDKQIGALFMHELGHNLGLFDNTENEAKNTMDGRADDDRVVEVCDYYNWWDATDFTFVNKVIRIKDCHWQLMDGTYADNFNPNSDEAQAYQSNYY